MALNMRQNRKERAFSRRSRTGCRTCRIRHIKCDETPGSCTNCTSTGRTCDGYAMVVLPAAMRKGGRALARPRAYLSLNLPGATSTERRCFAFFQNHTVPMLVGYFDSHVWQQLVLQLSQAEPAVCHAAVALGALHEITEARDTVGKVAVMNGRLHDLFALEQYCRAISMLRQRLGSKDPQLRFTALICCLIFVFYEFIQEKYVTALMHLKNGMYLLANQKGYIARSSILTRLYRPLNRPSTAETALASAFAHLEIQSAHFDSPETYIRLYPTDYHLTEIQYDYLQIQSLQEAKEKLDPIINNVFRFLSTSDIRVRDKSANHLTLHIEQHKMRTNLLDHISAFEEFLLRFSPRTEKETRSIDLIRLHHLILLMNVETFLSLSEMVFDVHVHTMEKCVDLCERIAASFRAEYADNPPNLLMDLGIIPPLSWISLKCRGFGLRRRALDVLRSWPHREGPHHSMDLMYMSREVVAIEEGGFDELMGCIPELSRVRTVGLEKLDGSSAVLLYALSDPCGERLDLRRRVFLMDGRAY
ncbi:Zn(II)2Cys6 transcription factor [Aspergillus alliaceus]|uniref:Zn(II)2Cys6 transcription factor n=1 Tax=Petromyces alliaceus TaxID=209559 RepID=UPI0012A5B7A1|nr:C6 zinc finger domain protein [Aspergillus alliaceus]KAB8235754.1 C6 zinc finger domain protein [Aspergillus alliaceus]